MQRFIIERDIAGASDLTEDQLADIATKSNATIESLGVPYRWVTSYVAGDKIYCIHEADEESVRTAIGQLIRKFLPPIAVGGSHREVAQHAPFEAAFGRRVLARRERAGGIKLLVARRACPQLQ